MLCMGWLLRTKPLLVEALGCMLRCDALTDIFRREPGWRDS